MDFNFTYIDLANVRSISRGDLVKMRRYILQFEELLTERLELLREALEQKDRFQIRQITHKMIPQLKFFGVRDVSIPIGRLELEFETMAMPELKNLVDLIIFKLNGALKEVQELSRQNID